MYSERIQQNPSSTGRRVGDNTNDLTWSAMETTKDDERFLVPHPQRLKDHDKLRRVTTGGSNTIAYKMVLWHRLTDV